VESLPKLDHYSWSGHSALVGRLEYNWQDTAYVLKWFGERLKQARQVYRQFVEEGIALGRQPHLVGGGLIRSAGGWSEVKALRRIGAQEKADERTLGSGPFVAQVLDEADLTRKYRLANLDRKKMAAELIENYCEGSGISMQALSRGSRRRHVSKVRREPVCRLTEELGLSFAETARLLGVSTSAVAKIMLRRSKD
jgi:hypothetical protein